MIAQNDYIEEESTDIDALPEDRIILRRDLAKYFPGDPIAAVSYVLTVLQVVDLSHDAQTSGMNLAHEDWIPQEFTNGLDIINVHTGGSTIRNHFHDWILHQRNATANLADIKEYNISLNKNKTHL